MKSVPNLTYTMKIPGKPVEGKPVEVVNATTARLLEMAMHERPEGGFTYAVMRERLRVTDAAEKATDTIQLEDADYAVAVRCVKECRWVSMHPDILKFCDQFV